MSVYKPKGWTSFDVVAKLKPTLVPRPTKIGHAGTLDPLAEGVLIVLTDNDTKRQAEFMAMEKEYRATIAFGVSSPTYDLEGPLTFFEPKMRVEELQQKLQEVIPSFIGTINQQVPAYSAVKVQGQRLYKVARRGDPASLPSREVSIHSITVDKFDSITIEGAAFPTITLTIKCGKGTYIRSLASDLGQAVGVPAVLTNLVRTRVGDFDISNSMNAK